jgi:hypothetical protein
VFIDTFKIDENMTVGADISFVNIRPSTSEPPFSGLAGSNMQNIGINFNGKLGIVKLIAEVDFQMGKNKYFGSEYKFKGNQFVVQGNVAVDPATINFLLAMGSGGKATDTDEKQYINFLDIDPHYTFLYEYKLNTAAGRKNSGFANTTVLGLGGAMDASKSVKVGLDLYFLKATEKIFNGMGEESDEIGTEIDAKVYWKLADNLSWNWDLGYFMPGKAFKTASGKTDSTMGIQGILAFKF